MKAATLAFLAAALSFAVPAVAAPVQDPGQSPGQSTDNPGASYDQKVGAPTTVKPDEQQAQLGNASDHDRTCADLKQRSKQLWDQADRSRDHGDFAHARDQLDQINAQLTRECGK
ncbi:MAG TPA: hypothetical protein VHY80_17730 [Stellaceae bacterium]|nr:hypothetical protein [Stellaceae bacterium]